MAIATPQVNYPVSPASLASGGNLTPPDSAAAIGTSAPTLWQWEANAAGEIAATQAGLLDNPPSSPTIYDDEFNESTLGTQWTGAETSFGSVGLQAPSYLLEQIPANPEFGEGTLVASEFVVTAAGFMFQTRVKVMCGIPYTASAQFVGATFGVAVGSKSFGVQVGIIGNESTYYPGIAIVNGNSFANTVQTVEFATISDLRIRIGLSGSNLVALISPDGFNWVQIYSEAFSGSGTSLNGNYPNGLYLQLTKPANTNSFALAAWDYVRKIS